MGESGHTQNKVSLYLGDSPEALWQQVALPWLRKHGPQAWRQPHPVVVLVPHRTAAFAFKQRTLQAKLNLLGVEFWTPQEVRLYMRTQYGRALKPPVARETLDLILRVAAREVLLQRPANRSAAAVVADSAAFRQVLDRVLASGVEAESVFLSDLNEVIRVTQQRMQDHGWSTSQEELFWLEKEAPQRGPVFAASLAVGFSGEDWAFLPLLSAALNGSAEATLGFLPPTAPGEESDQLFISTLEERFGTYRQLDPQENQGREGREISLRLAKDLGREVRVIVAQVVSWLAEDLDAKIAVAVPPASPLGLLVAQRLSTLDIPVHSRFGFRRPGMLEDAAWQRWLDYLIAPKLATFLALTEVLEPRVLRALAEAGPDADYDYQENEKALESAYQQTLSDELPVLAAWMDDSEQLSERNRRTGLVIQRLSSLPIEGELSQLWESFVALTQQLGWHERAELLQPQIEQVVDAAPSWIVPAPDFLGWLQSIGDTRDFSRPAEAHHYYARVHLLTPAEAAGQEWTHLYLAGLTEGVWPPVGQEEAFLSWRESQQWQRRLRAQLHQVVREGSQGEGQDVLPRGLTWPAGESAALVCARRAFQACWQKREGTVLACSAHLGDETRPSLPLLPSEFYLQAIREEGSDLFPRAGLEDAACHRLAANCEAWADEILGPEETNQGNESFFHLEAYRQRRTGEKFTSYEFTLQPGSTPPRALRLSCGDWERVLQAPATAFLQHLLGVSQRAKFSIESFSARSRGVWTHQWLGGLVPQQHDLAPHEWPPLVPLPSLDEPPALLRRNAEGFRDRVSTAWQQADQVLPAWWQARWEQALGLVLDLAKSWEGAEGCSHVATEWTLREHPLSLGGEENLWLRGRVDVLLGDREQWQEATQLLILDYKTGARSEFRVSKMQRDGSGVQLALYAMLLAQLTSVEVSVAMVSPQKGLSDRLGKTTWQEFELAWHDLVRMQNSGILGWRLPLRDPFLRTESMPLATLAVPKEVGKRKWRQAHPAWEGLV